MSKKPAAAAAAAPLKGKLPAGSKEARIRDECVYATIDTLFQGIDLYIADKAIFPKILAHAVGRTMAEVVHMVSIAHVQRMETWLVSLEGGAPEEWDKPVEPLIPLVDSWARGVIPIRKITDASPSATPMESSPRENMKQPRQASFMALSSYQDQTIRRRSSDKSMRGSLRRFSDSPFPFDPSRKVKFQEKSGDDTAAAVPKDSPGSRRTSLTQTVTTEDIKTSPKEEKGAKANTTSESTGGGSRRSSLSKDDKAAKAGTVKASPSTKKKP